MVYTPNNNPYIAGDPYSYDLKWLVRKVKAHDSAIESLPAQIQAAVIAALDQHDPVYYNTAAELIASGQKASSIAYIEGFNSAGDSGANLYYITDDYNDIIGADFYLTMAEPNLWALPVILTPYVTPEMFGAKGDGVTDDTNALKIAIKTGDMIVISNTYAVDTTPANCITIAETNKIICGTGTIKALETNLDISNVLKLDGASNITIKDITLVGDIDYNTSTTEGAAHCLNIRSSNNITIENIKIYNAYTDGIYIINGFDIFINGFKIDRCGRNGFTVTNGQHIKACGGHISNISNHAPQAGISVEPNFSTDKIYDIVFSNIYIENTAGYGFYANLNRLTVASDINITFENITTKTVYSHGLIANESVLASGVILIDGLKTDDVSLGVFDYKIADSGNIIAIINNVSVGAFNTSNSNLTYGAFIAYGAVAYDTGNLYVDNIIFSTPSTFNTIYIANGTGTVYNAELSTLNSFNIDYVNRYPSALNNDAASTTISNIFDTITRSGASVAIRQGRKKGILALNGNAAVFTFIGGQSIDYNGTTGTTITMTGQGYAEIRYYDENKAVVIAAHGITIS